VPGSDVDTEAIAGYRRRREVGGAALAWREGVSRQALRLGRQQTPQLQGDPDTVLVTHQH
jgi:hypothetical protein